MVCAGCGFELAPGFAFCPRCGRRQANGSAVTEPDGIPTSPAPMEQPREEREADRRQVTVLFADVTGFTTLAERLDPEEVRAFQSALFETLAQVVARHDGFVEKFIGDAVLAVFGAPLAHEDDPERALNAALDMVAALTRLDEQWAARLGQAIGLHIGVHTGPVVAGHLGRTSTAAYAVTGDTVNTTARLLAEASGAILVSEATGALTRHRFAFGPARALALKGKAEPVLAYPLTGLLAAPASGRGLAAHGLASPMTGRAGELAQLIAAFDRMRTGRSQVIDLAGEPGSGKSRLLAEFLAALEARGR
jgi:adenylate cyclase